MNITRFPHGGVWIPAEKSGSDWLLVALHGSGGSAHDFDGLDKIFDIPEMNYLYLNGPIKSYSSFMWYDSSDSRHDAYRILDEAFQQCEEEGYPPERTFMLGFSQGAALTFEFGVRYPKLLAGYIAISGRIEELTAIEHEGLNEIIKNAHWLVTHGSDDYNLSIDIMKQQVDKLKQYGLHIDFQEFKKIHEMDASLELPYIRDWIIEKM